MPNTQETVQKEILLEAFYKMCLAKEMTEFYEANFKLVSKYVHATSRGHEAIQLAVGMQLLPQDLAFPYYRDDSILLGIGMRPYDLMLQLLAKEADPFSGGRTYYSHPSLRDADKPKIPHQSSATGMQGIPATGAALGLRYNELHGLEDKKLKEAPIVMCSFGDASITEGEVSEAFQMASLKALPILYIVQDNEWDISASADEIRSQDAYEYLAGFTGIEAFSIDGSDFEESYRIVQESIRIIREERRPVLIHATVPLLNHHTSGVRMEWYRDDLEEDKKMDPYPKLRKRLRALRVSEKDILAIEKKAKKTVAEDFEEANAMPEPKAESIFDHEFSPTDIRVEEGTRTPEGADETVMVDSALHAIEELMTKHPECLLYGQDVGIRLGGVFREAATLAEKFGKERVFNTPIQEAFIVGSTVGMSAVGLKPIVEVQFADYLWPGLNQLFTEVSRSCYLSMGKYPVSMILRVPIGAYGSGGPYHSSSIETVVTNIRGLKIAYPSTGADFKGLMKAAYYDPNPVVMFEHKGLYWSKVPGTKDAMTIEPAEDYILPFGKARIVQMSSAEQRENNSCLTIITYGMGVYWAKNAAQDFGDRIEIIDLRTLAPLDKETVFESVKLHGRCIVLTEEPREKSFAMSLAGLIQEECFEALDAPVRTVGSENLPAIGLNSTLEQAYLPSAEKLKVVIEELLAY